MGNVLLVLFAVLGMGALLISLYVFTASARRFVSDDETTSPGNVALFSGNAANESTWKARGEDRRQSSQVVSFPLEVNGELVREDRRVGRDRRASNDRRRSPG